MMMMMIMMMMMGYVYYELRTVSVTSADILPGDVIEVVRGKDSSPARLPCPVCQSVIQRPRMTIG
jgi:hypothetical protein